MFIVESDETFDIAKLLISSGADVNADEAIVSSAHISMNYTVSIRIIIIALVFCS